MNHQILKQYKLRVVFLLNSGVYWPSSRYRIAQYLNYLISHQIKCRKVYFYSGPDENSRVGLKAKMIFFLQLLFETLRNDIIYLPKTIILYHRWFSIIRTIFSKIVVDFDDAVFLFDQESFNKIVAQSNWVIVGNNYLKSHALPYNKNVSVIPTSVDIEKYYVMPLKSSSIITIGWIGHESNIHELKQLEGVFSLLRDKYNGKIVLKVVSNQDFFSNHIKVVNEKWNLSNEIEKVSSFDIGIMPLSDNEWVRGKCGAKLLQYMAAGVPAISSPVGVAKEIIKDGVNGFLAMSEKEWVEKLSYLIEDEPLRKKLGKQGRQTVEERYSVRVNAPKLKNVLENVYTC